VSDVLCACVFCVCVCGLWFVLSPCGPLCALCCRLVVVCAVCSALYVCCVSFHQLWKDLYVLCQFSVYDCDLCVVLERLCVCVCVCVCGCLSYAHDVRCVDCVRLCLFSMSLGVPST